MKDNNVFSHPVFKVASLSLCSEQNGGGFLSSVNSGCKYILKAIRQSIFIFAHNKLQAQNWWHKLEGYSLRLHATSA